MDGERWITGNMYGYDGARRCIYLEGEVVNGSEGEKRSRIVRGEQVRMKV